MSFHPPEGLEDELANIRSKLDSRQYGHSITEYAETLDKELDEDYPQRDLENLLASYRETFPDFYEEKPISSVKDYLTEFDNLEDALQPLEEPE